MKRLTKEQFIEKARKIHGNIYDYSKVEYINKNTKVCIICPEHGEFWQTPDNHFKGQNCPKCANISRGNVFRDSQNEFIKRAREVHGNKYDYSKVKYINNRTKVCIICPEHGEFWQRPYSHLQGFGCRLCNDIVYNTDSFVKKSIEIYGNEYDYSRVNYTGSKTKVCIICPKHGEFFVSPNNFLRGHTCPICKQSKLEKEVKDILESHSIEYEQEKMFNWLGSKRIDFYLPDYSLAIECQGGQHFRNVEWFGGTEGFSYRKKRDKDKKTLCEEHNIGVLYFTHEKYDSFLGEKTIKTAIELLERIKEDRKKEYKPEIPGSDEEYAPNSEIGAKE
jgi:very-short-patch-repair endonuclease